MKLELKCWCGNTDLKPFSDTYLKCFACQTLVSTKMPDRDITHVTDEAQDLYGREYWFSHQEQDHNFPNITIRARSDLSERCLYWLQILLKYKLPPGRILELGSSHGGFVALLHWIGFEATGLEISPWVVDFARNTFDIPMLLGPVEEQPIEPSSLDLIVLMDVIEHLPDPVNTMQHCLKLLKPGGLLFIQTPCLIEEKTYADLMAHEDIFLKMLIENEHLFLFSQHSIRTFFTQLGYESLVFEPPLAGHDMLLVVSQSALEIYSAEVIEETLNARPDRRLIQALLDLYQHNPFLLKAIAEKDRYIASLQKALTRKEIYLTTALPARKVELASVKSVLQAREEELANLKPILQTREKELASIKATLQARETELQAIHKSKIWRFFNKIRQVI